jgi:hypothetical protein
MNFTGGWMAEAKNQRREEALNNMRQEVNNN